MAVLIISRGEYRNTDAIDRLTNYVLNPKKLHPAVMAEMEWIYVILRKV